MIQGPAMMAAATEYADAVGDGGDQPLLFGHATKSKAYACHTPSDSMADW